jgi:hypothetical protein
MYCTDKVNSMKYITKSVETKIRHLKSLSCVIAKFRWFCSMLPEVNVAGQPFELRVLHKFSALIKEKIKSFYGNCIPVNRKY